MTVIFFILLIIGGFNWMSIGLLQYDFIAGFFGTQASIFSRLIYIAIGVACVYILFDMLRNRGRLLLLSRHRNTHKIKQSNDETQNADLLAE